MTPLESVWTEEQTIDAARRGYSLARLCEGELRLAYKGHSIKSQVWDEGLAAELRDLLIRPYGGVVCLPRVWRGMPNERYWRQFEHQPFTKDYKAKKGYGSAFVSRPDMVEAIANRRYWDMVRGLWAGHPVTLVAHTPELMPMPEATSTRFIAGPPINAYAEIDKIERAIGEPLHPVVLCLGPTATVLAARLTRKGVQALDFGHLGSFKIKGRFDDV